MMTKIFGAAMIVSGGYLLGRVRTNQQKRRISALLRLQDALKGYESALSEYRCSAREYFGRHGPLGDRLLAKEPIHGLIREDEDRLADLMDGVKNDSYSQALERVRKYLSDLSALISALEEEAKTAGKALPLVTGAIGFLVAVFLY